MPVVLSLVEGESWCTFVGHLIRSAVDVCLGVIDKP